ncbi:MAG: DUF3313 domain-containing protein [Gammaproteobacteria bacterium]|nr:DUF3313 domain-containing protein [Gammaproteobacteria bacterium]
MAIRTFMAALLTLFLAGFAQAQDNPLAEVEGADDLEKVKRAKFRETYVNTGVDFTRYSKIYLGDALFDYRDVGPAERSRSSYSMRSSKGVFGISEADRAKFEEIVSDAFVKELKKGKKFTITDTIDENTMIMRGAVVDIVSRVPPEFVGRSEVYLASVGEATLVLEFLDGKTGEVLARVAERGRIGSGTGRIDEFSMPVNSATVTGDVRRWAASAARKLRSEIDSAVGG